MLTLVILVSDLESEMYQLSHLLIEQRNILTTLKSDNSSEDAKGVIDETEDNGEDCNQNWETEMIIDMFRFGRQG